MMICMLGWFDGICSLEKFLRLWSMVQFGAFWCTFLPDFPHIRDGAVVTVLVTVRASYCARESPHVMVMPIICK